MAVKSINKLLAMMAFMGMLLLMANWQVCLPDGCFFVPEEPVCQDGNCINEGAGKHISERVGFMTTTVNKHLPIQFFVLIVLGSVLLNNNKSSLALLLSKLINVIRYYFFEHRLFSFLFARGVLHPKIY